MNENNTAIKDARSLGLPKMLLLGLQHMFAMFGATILVPILVNTYFEGQGLSIQNRHQNGCTEPDVCRTWYIVLPCLL